MIPGNMFSPFTRECGQKNDDPGRIIAKQFIYINACSVRRTAEKTGLHPAAVQSVRKNIAGNWLILGVFILFFAMISTIALELIDKDKR